MNMNTGAGWRRREVLASAAGLFAAAMPAAGWAQADYPNRPIKIIVPFPPGGPTDAATRLLGQEMQATLGQPVIVDNRPGAAGALGIDLVAKAAPDGYTLGISGVGPTILLPALDPKLPYRPLTDLSYVGATGLTELMFCVAKDLPASNMQQLLKLARDRARQGKPLTYGSTGQGGPIHVSFEYLKLLARVDMTHVPYKGDPQQLQDLMGGQIDVALITPPVALPQVKAGRIKPIAVAGATRSKLTPDLPTAAESGLPGYQANVFTLLVAPLGTPAAVVARLNGALNAALAKPAVQEKYLQMGMTPLALTHAQTRDFVHAETQRWSEVIRQTKVTRDQ
jgi:tripartite-type tricarboxylate transporter receptor subunit TctC